jgi:hypothetical protein
MEYVTLHKHLGRQRQLRKRIIQCAFKRYAERQNMTLDQYIFTLYFKPSESAADAIEHGDFYAVEFMYDYYKHLLPSYVETLEYAAFYDHLRIIKFLHVRCPRYRIQDLDTEHLSILNYIALCRLPVKN